MIKEAFGLLNQSADTRRSLLIAHEAAAVIQRSFQLVRGAGADIQRSLQLAHQAEADIRRSFQLVGGVGADIQRSLNVTNEYMKSFREMRDAVTRSSTIKILDDLKINSSFQLAKDILKSEPFRIFQEMEIRNRELFRNFNLIAQDFRPLAIAGTLAVHPSFVSELTSTVDELQATLEQTEATKFDVKSIDQLFGQLVEICSQALARTSSKVEIRAVSRIITWLIPILISLYLAHLSSQQISELSDDVRSQSTTTQKMLEENKKQSELHDKAIASKLDALSLKLDQLMDGVKGVTFYIVQRPVPLNKERHFTGPVVTWLLPGQEVELVDRHGKWIKVITYDLTSNQCLTGWVLKKYLHRIN